MTKGKAMILAHAGFWQVKDHENPSRRGPHLPNTPWPTYEKPGRRLPGLFLSSEQSSLFGVMQPVLKRESC
jgi:hypothetical protein